jgi:hypothetical protein
MTATKLVKRVFLLLAGLLGALVGVIVVLMVIGISVDTNFLRGAVATAASAAIDREVQINGPVTFHFSATPGLEVANVNIANPPQGRADRLLEAGHIGLSIDLRSLLTGDIYLGEIRARDVMLNLESDANGIGNWQQGMSRQSSAAGTGGDQKDGAAENDGRLGRESGAKRPAGAIDLGIVGIDEIALDNITVNYHDAAIGKSLQFKLEQVKGTAGRGQAVQMDLKGSLQQQAFSFSLESDVLTQLQQDSAPWKLSMDGQVRDTPLQVKGGIITSMGQPGLLLETGLGRVDVGALLAWLGVAEGMQAETEALGVKLLLMGDSLNKLVEESTLELKVHGGHVAVHDPGSEASFDIAALSGELRMQQGNPLTITLQGQIQDEPVDILILGASLAEYVSRRGALPLTVELGIVESKLSLSSTVQLPLKERGMKLKLKFRGPSLDAFNDLLELKLPAFGPLQVEADMALTSSGYDVSKLLLAVGESHL